MRYVLILLLLVTTLVSGISVNALTLQYDHTAIIECLSDAPEAQYNGGIIQNPNLNNGLEGWSKCGDAKINLNVSKGSNFIIAHSRHNSYDSMSQEIYMLKDKLYAFLAWIQLGEGSAPITAVFKTSSEFKYAGTVIAESGCWSMLKGGLTVDESGPAELYFEGNNTSVEIWVDSVSLQPFTEEEWRLHQVQNIEKKHKERVKILLVDKQSMPLANATIALQQKTMRFPIGCAINKNILTNTAYQNWFTARFKFTTFEDEMKWYSTEPTPGYEDYSVADAMLQFADKHSVAVRGHNIIWEDPHYQPNWVYSLDPNQLASAVEKRIISIVKRYGNRVIGWDAVNENLHFSYYESKLVSTASASIFTATKSLDSKAPLFLNEYNTIEDSRDGASAPAMYIKKIRELQQRGCGNLAIGLEGHFETPNLPYIRSTLDTLGTLGLPVWITEVDVRSGLNQGGVSLAFDIADPNGTSAQQQANYLEQILREVYAHPKVQGIVIWAAWKPRGGCYRMCLTDDNFRNLPTGDVVDKLLKEWGVSKPLLVSTDSQGFFEASLNHGEYSAKVMRSTLNDSSILQSLDVDSAGTSQETLVFEV